MTQLAPGSPNDSESTETGGSTASSADGVGSGRWWSARWVMPLALLLGYLAQVGFRLSLVTQQDYPVVNPDEQMYLVIARTLAGLPTTQIPGNEVIPGGYPLLISPVFWITKDPVHAYHLIMGVNALISSLVFPLAYWALRRLAVPRGLSYVFAGAAVMLPPVVFYSQYAMADTALPPLVLAWLIGMHGLLSDGPRRKRVAFAVLAGVAGGYTLLVHDRGGPIVALTAVVLLAALVFKWAPRIASGVALACLGVAFVSKQVVTSWLVHHIDGAKPSAVGNAVLQTLMKPSLYRRTATRVIGHIWYFINCTWGIAALVIVVSVVVVFGRRFARADRVLAFMAVALMFGIALAAAAGLPNDHRIDTIIYARYLSPLVPVFFVAGAAVLFHVRGWKRLAYLGLASAGLTAVLTWVLIHLAHSALNHSYYILWGLIDIAFLSSRWTGSWYGVHAWLTAATALGVLAIVLVIRMLGGAQRRRAVLATGAAGVGLALFAAYATISITDGVTKPNTSWRKGDATGFVQDAGIKPGDKLVMDGNFRWETRMTMAYEILDGRVWTKDLTTGDTPPAEANVAALALWVTTQPPEASWPNHPKGWHVAVAHQDQGYVIWRRG